ncbi:unnamed protein product [Kuraishia capsulata CBS 1993]|uniref:Nudix hydrolase domain-containing protein n=1 Tax=Kuraishia capsulata CBS 1993 TaxID=1382522 RepID=W6MJY1_9ASCO|nr:uncharacterized protein KUCA_T00002269001 [Kuraishia capsulata CBS 1993]CDK26298.1 unnamed protein product [Kuraishia capsulata CBS 1993]
MSEHESTKNHDLQSVFIKTEKARTGRENQVYSPEGARIVAGCIALSEDKHKVIMITSSKHTNRWILPKGGVEKDEITDYSKAAERETWEEAGVLGVVTRELMVVHDFRFKGKKKGLNVDTIIDGESIPKSEFHFYEMTVEELATSWPEGNNRSRRWCTYSEAKHELIKARRLELLDALNDSNIIKDVPVIEAGIEGHQIDAHEAADEY